MTSRILMICNTANYLLSQGYSDLFSPLTISALWVLCFIKHHPELFKHKQNFIAVKHANAEDFVFLGLHFDAYNAV